MNHLSTQAVKSFVDTARNLVMDRERDGSARHVTVCGIRHTVTAQPADPDSVSLDMPEVTGHLLWMLDRIESGELSEGQTLRMVSFVQGVLWWEGKISFGEVDQQSRPMLVSDNGDVMRCTLE